MGAVVAGFLVAYMTLLAAEPGKGGESYVIAVVAPAGPDDGCPSPKQVSVALTARLPGTVLPLGQPPRPGALRLAVGADAAGTTRVDLADQGGGTLLRRVLPVASGAARDCAALAETVALIVERYWREVGYDAPPLPPVPSPPPTPAPSPPRPPPVVEDSPHPPPAPPRIYVPLGWSLAAAIAGQIGDSGTLAAAALVALTFERPIIGHRIGFRFSAGVGNSSTTATQWGEASFRTLPARVGAYVPIRLPLGQLEPGIGVGVNVISVGITDDAAPATSLRAPGLCSGRFCASPGADAALGWALTAARHIYVRLLTRAGVTVPYGFVNADGGRVWSTARTYLDVGLESGLWFP
jgi:hypothetical protein